VGAASLVYSTLLNANTSTGIGVNNSGDAFVTGVAGTNLTTTPGAFLTSGITGYVAKINTNAVGSAALVYATYLGSHGIFPHGIAVDQGGDAYVAGMANAATLPATANAFQSSYNPGGFPEDAFVLGLNSDGSAVTYATYFGGSAYDWVNAIAVDAAGHIYITGFTESRDLPILNAFQTTINGGEDAFVAEFDPTAATGPVSLIYASYLGGSLSDTGYGIAVDSAGNAIVVGQASTGFPTVNAFESSFHGAFVAKIAPPQ
jgi:hypothetical protein